jgi:hypothetical protein
MAEMNAGPMKTLGDKYTMAATKMELYGFDAAAEQTQTLEDKLIAVWNGLRQNPDNAADLKPCHQDFEKALSYQTCPKKAALTGVYSFACKSTTVAIG